MEFSSGSTDKLSVFVSRENKNYTGFDYTELTFKFCRRCCDHESQNILKILVPLMHMIQKDIIFQFSPNNPAYTESLDWKEQQDLGSCSASCATFSCSKACRFGRFTASYHSVIYNFKRL